MNWLSTERGSIEMNRRRTVVNALFLFPLAAWLLWEQLAASGLEPGFASGVARFDRERGEFVSPSGNAAAEVPLKRSTASARSVGALSEEPGPSAAGGVRVRLDDRFQSTLRIIGTAEADQLQCGSLPVSADEPREDDERE
jgi:hypothetical protein